jgi:hypothetical protein
MVNVIAELMACTDCLMLVANDEPSDDRPNLETEIAAHLELEPCQHIACGDSDQDDEFSWRPCECCGSPLGGARSQLVLLQCT